VRITGHGLSIELPDGWEGRIFRRAEAAPILHVASFPLQAGDGDFGAAATGRMGPDTAFAAMLEYRADGIVRPGVGLFQALGQPTPDPREFSPFQLQVTRPGQFGWQRFFTSGDRPSCLYAVVKPAGTSLVSLVTALSGVLATVERSNRAE
jgi:hypothetical protein